MGTIIPMSLNALSHDLRTPLVGILGMAGFLNKEHLTPTQREYTATILSEAKRLLDVVNAVTSYSCTESPDALGSKLITGFNPMADQVVKCRVLLVEDSPTVRKIHSYMLEEINCQFDIAVDAKQALSMVFDANGESNYDVILMDIGLGEGMNGLEASAEIRQHENGKKIRIIALSAIAEEEMKKNVLAAHVDGFANKPVGVAKLREVIYGT